MKSKPDTVDVIIAEPTYSTGGRIVVVGALVIGLLPLLALVGIGGGELLGCKGGGSSGPSSGCFGMSWIADIGLLAFLGSFFAVPIGVIIMICGLIARWFESRTARGRQY
jgi:hypothetical protein